MPWTVGDVEEHNKGLSATKKRQWVAVANSALKKCIDDGGTDATCAAGAIRQANAVVAGNEAYTAYRTIQGNNYNVRTETHQGRRHLVVPVIMMVEGVHNGTRGPLLHLADELGKVPDSWNGIPITVHHPEENGNIISANRPDVVDNEVVGRVYNTAWVNGKLKAEAWLDEEKLKQYSSVALAYIHQQRPLDVSVGVFTDDEMTAGAWNGETYEGIAHNHRPDHLALLPGGTGACSWADGCGIRANQEQNGGEGGDTEMPKELVGMAKKLASVGCAITSIYVNEVGLRDRLTAIQSKLDSLDTLQKTHYLQEVFDNYVVYEVVSRGGPEAIPMGGGGALFKQNYTVGDNGLVELTGDPTPVKKEIKYVALAANELTTITAGGVTMPENKKTPCCPEKVKLLVQSENSPWQETDREWLDTLEAPMIDKLVAQLEMVPVKDATPKPITKEEALQALKEQFADPEKALALFPAEMQEQMRHGMSLHKAEKEKLISLITANSKDFTVEELAKESIERLTKLASLIKQPETDYTVYGGGNNSAQKEGNILLPPGVKIEAEATK